MSGAFPSFTALLASRSNDAPPADDGLAFAAGATTVLGAAFGMALGMMAATWLADKLCDLYDGKNCGRGR